MSPRGLTGDNWSPRTANLPVMPESVNTERRRDRKLKYAKRAVMDFPEDLLDDGDMFLDILNAGHKRNIKTANINTLNYIRTPRKKIKI